MTPTPKPRRSGATIPESERAERGQRKVLVRLEPDDYALLERIREPGETDPAVLRRAIHALGIGRKSGVSRKSTAPNK